MKKILIFYGSDNAFSEIIPKRYKNLSSVAAEMDEDGKKFEMVVTGLPQQEAQPEKTKKPKVKILNFVINADEYNSVQEHVITNFINFIAKLDITNMYIQNPPIHLLEQLNRVYGDKNIIQNEHQKYSILTAELMRVIYSGYDSRILGQEKVKELLLKSIYPVMDKKQRKPVVVLFYGDSGLGKTETVQYITEVLGGSLLRKQFSMYQNNEFANYLFGGKYNEKSFAKDLLSRDSNVILLDEFDKANPLFHSAFYQLFDEGIYVDHNYKVDMNYTLIFCTSNYQTLVDNKLIIEEKEAVAIRKIFEMFTTTEIGYGGIAKSLNLQGIEKIPRQNGKLKLWSGHFVKLILDNPVYQGKLAYGRRAREKVKGTKNDYQLVKQDDYILVDGQHEAIIPEEVWEKARVKRLKTGIKQPSKIGKDRVHLLSGIMRCPNCGSQMYTNKHAWTNKDGTYKEIYYYVCGRSKNVTGRRCDYKAMLKKTDIEPLVIEAIREIVRNKSYANEIKKRIGIQIDTGKLEKEHAGYAAKLKEVDLNKTRLEREIDSLPWDAKYRDRKIQDMTLRLDGLYDTMVELEEQIEDVKLRIKSVEGQAITLENIYMIMENFDVIYGKITEEEKRTIVTSLIKEIQLFRNDESDTPLKSMTLNFPVFLDGGVSCGTLLEKSNTVETVVLMSRI